MLRIIRDRFDFEEKGGILLFPNSSAIRDAVLRLLPPGKAKLGNWTFTPKSFISDFDKYLDLPKELDSIDQVFLVKRILASNPELSDSARIAGIVIDISSVLLALRRAGYTTDIGFNKAYAKKSWRYGARQKQLAELLQRYNEELKAMDCTDSAERESAAIDLLCKKGPSLSFGHIDKVSAIWFDELRHMDARILVAMACHTDVDFYLPTSDIAFEDKKLNKSLMSSVKLLEDIATELGVEVIHKPLLNTKVDIPARDIVLAIAARNGYIENLPKSIIGQWPRLTVFEAKNGLQENELVSSAVKALHLDNSIAYESISIFTDNPEHTVRDLDDMGIPFIGPRAFPFVSNMISKLVLRIRDTIESDISRKSVLSLFKNPLLANTDIEQIDTLLCAYGFRGIQDLPLLKSENIKENEREAALKALELLESVKDILFPALYYKKITGNIFSNILWRFFKKFDISDRIMEQALQTDSYIKSSILFKSFENIEDLIERFKDSPEDYFSSHCDLLVKLIPAEQDEIINGQGVHIRPLSEIYRCDTKIAIIPGCIQGDVPKNDSDYLFLTSSEAVGLGINLENSLLRRFYNILTVVAKTDLTIMTHSLSEEDRPLPPSPIIVSFMRALGDNKEKYLKKNAAHASSLLLRSFSLKNQQIEAGRLLCRPRAEIGTITHKLEGVKGLDRAIHSLRVFNYIKKFESSIYDGVLGRRFSCEKSSPRNGLSVTRLNSYNICPLNYFFSKILGIETPPEPEEPIERKIEGSVFHKALELLWKKRIEGYFDGNDIPWRIQKTVSDFEAAYRKIAITSENYQNSLNSIEDFVSEAISNQKIKDQDFSIEDFKRRICLALKRYIEALVKISDEFVPIATETSLQGEFNNIPIYGKVDRIDCDSRGRLRIIDYKSGGSPKLNDILEMNAIQLPLYCLMAEKYGDVVGAHYWIGFSKLKPSLSARFEREDYPGDKNENSIPMDEWRALLDKYSALTKKLIADIDNCNFPPEPAGGECPKWCEFFNICNKDISRPPFRGGENDKG
ncbi:PD-(D/E)XK nuclease family protein [bacterium]|nr:PD-(D/E)XK nuclease family protein [bacterium]